MGQVGDGISHALICTSNEISTIFAVKLPSLVCAVRTVTFLVYLSVKTIRTVTCVSNCVKVVSLTAENSVAVCPELEKEKELEVDGLCCRK